MKSLGKNVLAGIEARVRAASGEDVGSLQTLTESAFRIAGSASMTPARELLLGVVILQCAAVGLHALGIDPLNRKLSISEKIRKLDAALSRHRFSRAATIAFFTAAIGVLEAKLRESEEPVLAAYRFGNDGHPLTREAAAALRLVRVFEPESLDFDRVLVKVFSELCDSGAGFRVWHEHLPLFFCDLRNPRHRKAAFECAKVCGAGFAIVTPKVPPEVEGYVEKIELGKRPTVVYDAFNRLAPIFALRARAVLLERRMGGWTLTYPLGGCDPRELVKSTHPAWARALSQCGVTVKRKD